MGRLLFWQHPWQKLCAAFKEEILQVIFSQTLNHIYTKGGWVKIDRWQRWDSWLRARWQVGDSTIQTNESTNDSWPLCGDSKLDTFLCSLVRLQSIVNDSGRHSHLVSETTKNVAPVKFLSWWILGCICTTGLDVQLQFVAYSWSFFLTLFCLHLLLEVAHIWYLHLHLFKTPDEWKRTTFCNWCEEHPAADPQQRPWHDSCSCMWMQMRTQSELKLSISAFLGVCRM